MRKKNLIVRGALTAALCMQMGILSYGSVYIDSEEPTNEGVEVSWEIEGVSGAEYGYCEGFVGAEEAPSRWDSITHTSSPNATLTKNGNYTFFVKDGEDVWVETYTLSLIDMAPPKITINILDTYDGQVSFKVKVSDANGIADKRIIEGSHGPEMYDSAESFSNETLTYPSGTYTLYARDRAGNLSVSEITLEASTQTESAPSVDIVSVEYEDGGRVTAHLNVSSCKEVRCIKGDKNSSAWDSAKDESDLILSKYESGKYTLLVKADNGKIWAYPLELEGKAEVETEREESHWSTEWSEEDRTFGAEMTWEYADIPTTAPPTVPETQPPTEPPTEPTLPPTEPVEPSDPVEPSEPDRPTVPETLPPAPTEPETVPPTVPETVPPTRAVPKETPEAVGSVTVLPQTGGFDVRAIAAVVTSLTGMGGAGLYFGSKWRRRKGESEHAEEHDSSEK